MLDPKIIRDEPDRIKQMLKDRAVEFDFEKMLELDKKRRDVMFQTDELRQNAMKCRLRLVVKKRLEMTHQDYYKRWARFQKNLTI